MSEQGPHDEPTRAGNPWGAPPPGPSGPTGPPPPPPYQPYGAGGPGHPPPPGPPFQPRKSRLPLVLGIVAAVLVLAAAVTVPLVLAGDDEPSDATDSATDGPTDGPTDDTGEPAPADLSEVREYADLPTTHVELPVTYEQSPPVGGEHYPRWLECGVYDEPVPNEPAVHDLEHGTFWFTYDAEALSDEDVDALAAQLPDNGIMSPYEGLESPVVVTVWERQLALTGVDDPRLPLFLDEFAGGETSPEPFASCSGGITPDEYAGLETS